jgi:hypothetical protein
MTSQIRVDSIVPTTGVPTGGGGGIVQCVQEVLTSTVTVTSTSFTDVGLSATITPRSNSNKILVIADISSSGANGNYILFQLVRGSTNIYLGTDSKTYVASKAFYPFAPNTDDGSAVGNTNMFFLDSPATTSPTTYKVQVRVTSNTGTINGRDDNDTCLASSLTLMEVSA